jgi:PKD repeat protein
MTKKTFPAVDDGMTASEISGSKRYSLIITTFLILLLLAPAVPVAGAAETGPDATGRSGQQDALVPGTATDPFAVIDGNLAPGEAAALRLLIQNTLHAFSYNEETGAWYARNAENRITFVYTKNGTAEFSSPAGSFGLSPVGIGREGAVFAPAGPGVAASEGRQLNITRQGYTEWYRNHDDGVEQGVTVIARPAGTGPLLVRFTISGTSTFSPGSGPALMVTDSVGSPLFTYTGLHAFSADGRELPASLATDGTTLSWIVDDTGAVYPVTIDPVVASASTAAATFTGAAAGDFFGYSVALSSDGSRALVGAYGNDAVGSYAGAAYLFAEPVGGWAGTTPATAAAARFTGAADYDQFGDSVALSSDGSRALVGAHWNDTAGANAGAAYLFSEPAGGWAGTTPATAAAATFTGAAANDEFGRSVALSSDGSRALVGAHWNDTAGANAGAAYLFAELAGGWAGTIPASTAAATFTGAAADDFFGDSVALSSDGSRALVGAIGNDAAGSYAGAAYLFAEPVGGWAGTTPASGAAATFTGAAAGDFFGDSVALSSDGSRALVGAYYNDAGGPDASAAYLFSEPAGGWAGSTPATGATATFTGAAAYNWFGYSVALSSDGSRALVGAYYNDAAGTNAGAAYLFRPPYATLTAGGVAAGNSGTTVNGLTLNPSGTLTTVDLYLGTDASTPVGTALRTGIASLPASTATTVDGVDLAGKAPGPYYLIACEHGTSLVLAATAFPVYTVLPPAVVSGFTGSPTSGIAPLTVTFTDESTNTPTNWAWNFGSWSAADGGVSALQHPSHTYTSAGTYTVSLSARNGYGGDTHTEVAYITVTDPGSPAVVSSFTATPVSGPAPLTVAFTDESTNTPTNWAWNFGSWSAADNGVSTLQNPSHTYSSAGTYTISLHARNANGGDTITRTGYITVTDPGSPAVVSGFSATPVSGPAPLTVTFTDESTNTPTNWAWNFGSWSAADHGVSMDQHPSHVYSNAGTYTVSLSARNANGGDTFTRTSYITVTGAPVTTSPTAVPGSGSTAGAYGQSGSSGSSGGSDSGTGPAPVKQGSIVLFADSAYLAGHGVTPSDIRVMSYSGGRWMPLDTRFTGSSGNRFSFSADADSIALFSIGNTKDGITGLPVIGGAATATAPTVFHTPVTTITSPPAETRAVSREETTVPAMLQPVAEPPAPAAAQAPAGSSGFPTVPLVLIVAGCIVLTGAGWYVRRWWIHRQNPALFREYD